MDNSLFYVTLIAIIVFNLYQSTVPLTYETRSGLLFPLYPSSILRNFNNWLCEKIRLSRYNLHPKSRIEKERQAEKEGDNTVVQQDNQPKDEKKPVA